MPIAIEQQDRSDLDACKVKAGTEKLVRFGAKCRCASVSDEIARLGSSRSTSAGDRAGLAPPGPQLHPSPSKAGGFREGNVPDDTQNLERIFKRR